MWLLVLLLSRRAAEGFTSHMRQNASAVRTEPSAARTERCTRTLSIFCSSSTHRCKRTWTSSIPTASTSLAPVMLFEPPSVQSRWYVMNRTLVGFDLRLGRSFDGLGAENECMGPQSGSGLCVRRVSYVVVESHVVCSMQNKFSVFSSRGILQSSAGKPCCGPP